jgi:hypothetical protein
MNALTMPGHCLGIVWVLSGHCLGIVWALPGHPLAARRNLIDIRSRTARHPTPRLSATPDRDRLVTCRGHLIDSRLPPTLESAARRLLP